jgi:flagellar hook-associated protein 2
MPGIASIEGLASNLNISEIVDEIMSYERIPVSYLEQDRDYKTQQVTAYQAVQAKFLALKSQVALLKREAAFFKADIQISDDSYLSASANGKVVEGSYDLKVEALAHNHQIASQGFSDAATEIFGTGSIQLAIGSGSPTTINIEAGQNSLVGIKDAINEANLGISASIINDGTISNPYRLLLTGDKTGAANEIDFNINLSGGETLDFAGTSFDHPELISMAADSTSQVSLGASASYAGGENKIYTFTVDGIGGQTVGSDTITVNWTDGVNSGSILVTQADAEVELFGDGADGLKLSFGAGQLNAGDTFQVSTFAPVLQRASDARVAIGSSASGGSPIVINSATNEFDEVLPSLSFTVKRITQPGQTININAKVDTAAIRTMVDDLIAKYNDVMDFIDEQFSYNQDTTESGVLFTEYPLQVMQSSIRLSTTSVVTGLENDINSLAAIGIRTGQNGQLKVVNSATLNDAIRNDLDSIVSLFNDSGSSSSPYIQFIGAAEKTLADQEFEIDITRAASKGYYQGKVITSPTASPLTLTDSNNKIKIKVDGVVSEEMVLSARTYESGEDLANEIRTRLDNDDKLKNRNIAVEWVELGNNTGYLKITSGTYGSGSKVELDLSTTNSAFNAIGLAGGTIHAGQDVEGTINGEKATGRGQVLTGDEDNAETAGLKLKITLGSEQVGSGIEGTISFVRGLAAKMDQTLENITRTIDGAIDRRVSALNRQIEEINKQISDYEERLSRRREDLYNQFLQLEDILGQYQSEGTYLESQLKQLNANWAQIIGNNK